MCVERPDASHCAPFDANGPRPQLQVVEEVTPIQLLGQPVVRDPLHQSADVVLEDAAYQKKVGPIELSARNRKNVIRQLWEDVIHMVCTVGEAELLLQFLEPGDTQQGPAVCEVPDDF